VLQQSCDFTPGVLTCSSYWQLQQNILSEQAQNASHAFCKLRSTQFTTFSYSKQETGQGKKLIILRGGEAKPKRKNSTGSVQKGLLHETN